MIDPAKCTIFNAGSREGIEKEIDAFLAKEKPHKPIDLILPVSGASKFEYRGLSVRKWYMTEQTFRGAITHVRFDAAVELL